MIGEERNKSIGVRVFNNQQFSARIILRRNSNQGMVAIQENGILVFFLQMLCCIEAAGGSLFLNVFDAAGKLFIRFKELDSIGLHKAMAAFRIKRAIKIVTGLLDEEII